MNSPLISIIVPVYNVERYLPKCLDSIQAQTFTDFEAVLVDDGSTDGSGRICDEYASKDFRFVVVHKQNEGVAKARITAFEHSIGELITFIDADDYVSSDYVQHLYDGITKYSADVACCQYFRVDHKGIRKSERKNIGLYDRGGIDKILSTNYWFDTKLRKSGFLMFFFSKMVKRDFVRGMLDAGNGMWYGEDEVGVLWLMYHINTLFNSDAPLYYYVIREGQATKRMGKERWDANVLVWQKMIEEDKKGFLKNQTPYRMFHHLKSFLDKNVISVSSFKEFQNIAEYAVESDILQNYLYGADLDRLRIKDRVKYFLIRNKCYHMLYLMGRIRKQL